MKSLCLHAQQAPLLGLWDRHPCLLLGPGLAFLWGHEPHTSLLRLGYHLDVHCTCMPNRHPKPTWSKLTVTVAHLIHQTSLSCDPRAVNGITIHQGSCDQPPFLSLSHQLHHQVLLIQIFCLDQGVSHSDYEHGPWSPTARHRALTAPSLSCVTLEVTRALSALSVSSPVKWA